MDACQFRPPWLDVSKDGRKARIKWLAEGAVVLAHQQQLVNGVGKRNRTYLYSSWMLRAEAERKLESTLAELQQGSSWSNMYEITAKACEEEHLLPHGFAMPRVVSNPFDKKGGSHLLASERHGCRAA